MLEWRPVETEDGSFTLAQPVHGETCHSTAGAWTQARERYARACRLRERARELCAAAQGAPVEFRLLDIGTGLGLNLAAALEALADTGVTLHAISLERDPSVLQAMLALLDERETSTALRALTSDLERWHLPIRRAIASALALRARDPSSTRYVVPFGTGSAAAGTLELCVADARETIGTLAPHARFDAIFLDPFSPRVEPDLWAPEFLFDVARCLAPGGWLSTYTVSLSVRAALVAAGLNVGRGERVGRKAQGTIACLGETPPSFDPRTQRRVLARAQALVAHRQVESNDASDGCFGIPRVGEAFRPTDVLELRLDEAG